MPIINRTTIHDIYREVNKFRADPRTYCDTLNWDLACVTEMVAPRMPLQVLEELEEASSFQANTMATDECPDISHDTCAAYCYLFGDSCSYDDRVKSFMGVIPFDTVREVL